MKKLYKTLLLAFAMSTAVAQSGFWTPTSYKGAFAPSPTPMWTDSWTEWDPINKVYPSTNLTVSSNITTNTTWSTGQVVLLKGPIYVKNNAVLTIQPGVIIKGEKATAGSALIITKGAQINAIGTASQPIVFTTDQAPGAINRAIGDWGGLVLLGKGALNLAGGLANIEGLPVSSDSEYGGGTTPNNNDNSGILSYVRIEFGGYVYATNKEINGLTLGAVGNATQIDHVQVSYTNDDAFEWFGGSVNAKYLVSFRNLDDDFDTDNGWNGNVQFGLIVRDPALADNPSVSTSEGFESDNDATGSTATPQTSGMFSNITGVGPYRGSSATSVATGYRRALRLRRNTALKIFNSVFMDFKTGIFIDGSLADANANSGALKFKNNLIATTSGVTPKTVETTTANAFVNPTWFAAQSNDSLNTSNNILTTPWNYTSPDYRPVSSNSLVTSGANFGDPSFASAGILSVNNLDEFAVQLAVYPNPNSGSANILINAKNVFELNVSVYSITGQLMAAPIVNYSINEGMQILPLNLNELANGIYFVTISNRTKTESIKMIVNK